MNVRYIGKLPTTFSLRLRCKTGQIEPADISGGTIAAGVC
jgi:hypothetical protein